MSTRHDGWGGGTPKKGKGTHQDHGIAQLSDKDGVPGDAAAHVQLVGRVLLLQLGRPGGGQAAVDIGAGGLLNLPDREEKGVSGELCSHRMTTGTGSSRRAAQSGMKMNRASGDGHFASLAYETLCVRQCWNRRVGRDL
jgi:hypothetical protein